MPVMGGVGSTGAGRKRPAPARFGAAILCALLYALPWSAQAQSCGADRIDERVRVSFVQDGDTLVLHDGRRLRLIGIDTPELGQHGRAPEPGAIAARDRLRHLMFTEPQLGLRFDQERHDRYGRLLAHAFFADGRNLVEILLAEGRGTQLVVPPNSWQAGCYGEVVDRARRQGRGVWAMPAFQPVPAARLDLRSKGFHVVRGRVTHLGDSVSALWINLAGNFAARIERRDLEYFKGFDFGSLVGREIEIQGHVQPRNGQARMTLRHPAALRVVPPGSIDPEPGSAPVE